MQLFSFNEHLVCRVPPPPPKAEQGANGLVAFTAKTKLVELDLLVGTTGEHKIPNLCAGFKVFVKVSDYEAHVKKNQYAADAVGEPFVLVDARHVVLVGT